MELRYVTRPPDGAIRPWMKLVTGVIPKDGNAFDVFGEWVRFEGVLPEWSVLCAGWKVRAGLHEEWPRSQWAAYQVIQTESGSNVIERAYSERKGTRSEARMIGQFPQLAPLAGKPMMVVQWALLLALEHQVRQVMQERMGMARSADVSIDEVMRLLAESVDRRLQADYDILSGTMQRPSSTQEQGLRIEEFRRAESRAEERITGQLLDIDMARPGASSIPVPSPEPVKKEKEPLVVYKRIIEL